MRRLDSALLAILGVLIAHQIAYLTSSMVGYENSVAHGHMKTAWLFGSAALLTALGRSIIVSLRRRHHNGGNPIHLAAAIGGGYFLMEQVERVVDGYGALTLFSEPVFWFGLAAAPLVAIVLSWLLASIEQAVSNLIEMRREQRPSPPVSNSSLATTSVDVFLLAPLSFVVARRGPPMGLEFS